MKKLVVSVSVLSILMASGQAFAERGRDAREGRDGLKNGIEKITNVADARKGRGNGNGGGNGNGNGNGHDGDHGHDDDNPGHCRGNVSPC